MSSDIYIVSKFNDGHMNEIGDKLTKKDNGLYWNHRTKSTVNVHMDNCIKLANAIEALERLNSAKIANINIDDSGVDVKVEGGLMGVFGEQFAETLGDSNYVELGCWHPDTGDMTVTLQKVDGITPAGKVQAIRDRVSLINVKAQKHGNLTCEELLNFIDSLDKVSR